MDRVEITLVLAGAAIVASTILLAIFWRATSPLSRDGSPDAVGDSDGDSSD